MKIWAHTLVRNEERYLWFAVTSVIDFIDKILLWDTGSTDNTLKIIDHLRKAYPDKIDFQQVGEVDKEKFTLMRQKMLDQTKSDWVIIVDGDEIWWNDSIKEIVKLVQEKGENLETIAHRYFNVIGDIYHYQEEKAGKYNIDGNIGHLTIRAINRNIPGLHFGKPHGQQGIFDNQNRLIQERDAKRRIFLDERFYLHFTHMTRSKSLKDDLKVMKRDIKIKYELGITFKKDFYYPEAFFIPRPRLVSSPWVKYPNSYLLKAALQTPVRYIKRRLITGKSGY